MGEFQGIRKATLTPALSLRERGSRAPKLDRDPVGWDRGFAVARHGIPDLQTFSVLGFAWPEVRNVSDADVSSVPKGSDYPQLPSRLLRNPAGTIFALQRGRRR